MDEHKKYTIHIKRLKEMGIDPLDDITHNLELLEGKVEELMESIAKIKLKVSIIKELENEFTNSSS